MAGSKRQMKLNLFIHPGGHHEAGWRYPGSQPQRGFDISYYQEMVRGAEAAKFDAIFLADKPVLNENLRYTSRYRVEPLTWLSAIAAVTSRIGLIATASTSFYEPYNLARLFSSLDHLSNGRAAVNFVTTLAPQAGGNFGSTEPSNNAERYERAGEFIDVVTKLWDCWEDDAIIADPRSGIFADDDKIHSIDHVGKYFRVKGPLNLARSPQGRPVYVQAGSSEDGRSFAAKYAEAIFTAHQNFDSAQRFYEDVKKRAALIGRRPEQVLILPGFVPFIGSTEAEAKALFDEFNDLLQPAASIQWLKQFTGLDLTGYDFDAPFPRDWVDATGQRAVASRFQLIMGIVEREKPTVRQLINKVSGGRGHHVLASTPEVIADAMQHWFENGAADGFNIMPPWLSGGFDVFVAEVLPILRRRGLFREEYEGTTLRDHYGLQRPESSFAGRTAAA